MGFWVQLSHKPVPPEEVVKEEVAEEEVEEMTKEVSNAACFALQANAA